MKGIITSVQSMCYDDGPGLRTTVFFKGCPLRCFWCHNPESLEPLPQIAWYRSQCLVCGNCVQVCERAVRCAAGPLRDTAPCADCTRCTEVCPSYALERIGTSWTVESLAERLLRERPYFERSGGGVTLSGGEPLLQWQFATALLRTLRDAGIHTAVETSGFASAEAFRTVVDTADLVIMDLKHLDGGVHRTVTGRSNGPILANFRYLCETGKPCMIRTPVISGVNDTVSAIAAIAKTAAAAPGLQYYELMPYHPLGKGKLESLGLAAASDIDLTPPSPETLQFLYNAARDLGIPVKT